MRKRVRNHPDGCSLCVETCCLHDGFELGDEVRLTLFQVAYKTSTSDQLSIESLNKRIVDLKKAATPLVEQKTSDWDRVSAAVTEANEIQRRVSLAVKSADENEFGALRSLSNAVLGLKRELDALVVNAPRLRDCEDEINTAVSEHTQKLYRALRQRLAPAEWQRAREVIEELSGEEPR